MERTGNLNLKWSNCTTISKYHAQKMCFNIWSLDWDLNSFDNWSRDQTYFRPNVEFSVDRSAVGFIAFKLDQK